MDNFSSYLRVQHLDLWNRANYEHPFVKGLGDGSLALNKFQYYLKQDYIFLFYYCKVLAIASWKSNSESVMSRWVKLLDETLNTEMDLHRRFCKDFGITEKELDATKSVSATIEYTDFILRNAEDNSVEFIAVSLLPCQWGYGEIGKNLSQNSSLDPKSFHFEWIESYNSPEYQEVTEWLIHFVDVVGQDIHTDKIQNFSDIFKRSIEFEISFWDSAWLLKSR